MRAPIEKRNTYELIAEQLMSEIGTRLRPGDPLPTERELTATFKVGRSSVREGLRMLESKGVIEPVGNGTFVVSSLRSPLSRSFALLLSLDEANLSELYELRRMLEGEAAALAAMRRSDEDLAAMALATRPRLLLLDEPMAGMGTEESQRMIALLAGLKRRQTIVLVEHDMDAVFRLADRISVLVYGRLIATDTPERIRANEEVRRAYLGEDL